jgi:hypothetical protein
MQKWLVLLKLHYSDDFHPYRWFDFRCDAVEWICKQLKKNKDERYRLVRITLLADPDDFPARLPTAAGRTVDLDADPDAVAMAVAPALDLSEGVGG